ncbi:DUF4238 domain-containing protein [Micromonospora sp. NPDC000663]|uniref:DUF4238 domain-containing protein n=1 Tax=Micromonospora sp. NPDC000663 TaxID=3364218 RepID=UPI0036D0C7ED
MGTNMADSHGRRQGLPSSWADALLSTNPDLVTKVDDWWASTSPDVNVGSRHHTVPKSYLQRFARKEQLLVRDRATGKASIRNIGDLAIKNFYTFMNQDGQPDGRLETILADVDNEGSRLFTRLLSPFHVPRPLDQEERLTLAQFIAFQFVRGARRRREGELLADYGIKLVNQGRLPKDASDLRIIPHPNEHLRVISMSAPKLMEALLGRPVTLVNIDQPLFITCDEPVIAVFGDDYVRHRPQCFATPKQRRRNAKRPSRSRKRKHEIVHFYPTRPSGLAIAEEVALPVSPTALIVLGPHGERAELRLGLSGADAVELAADVNQRLVDQAFEWVAAHPDHPAFRDMTFPPPGPLIQVCDGMTPMGQALDQAPEPRRPERLNQHWRN